MSPRQFLIRCDTTNCPAALAIHADNETAARHTARTDHNWTHPDNDTDHCPQHSTPGATK